MSFLYYLVWGSPAAASQSKAAGQSQAAPAAVSQPSALAATAAQGVSSIAPASATSSPVLSASVSAVAVSSQAASSAASSASVSAVSVSSVPAATSLAAVSITSPSASAGATSAVPSMPEASASVSASSSASASSAVSEGTSTAALSKLLTDYYKALTAQGTLDALQAYWAALIEVKNQFLTTQAGRNHHFPDSLNDKLEVWRTFPIRPSKPGSEAEIRTAATKCELEFTKIKSGVNYLTLKGLEGEIRVEIRRLLAHPTQALVDSVLAAFERNPALFLMLEELPSIAPGCFKFADKVSGKPGLSFDGSVVAVPQKAPASEVPAASAPSHIIASRPWYSRTISLVTAPVVTVYNASADAYLWVSNTRAANWVSNSRPVVWASDTGSRAVAWIKCCRHKPKAESVKEESCKKAEAAASSAVASTPKTRSLWDRVFCRRGEDKPVYTDNPTIPLKDKCIRWIKDHQARVIVGAVAIYTIGVVYVTRRLSVNRNCQSSNPNSGVGSSPADQESFFGEVQNIFWVPTAALGGAVAKFVPYSDRIANVTAAAATRVAHYFFG